MASLAATAALPPLLVAQLLAPSPQPGPVRQPAAVPSPPRQERPATLAPETAPTPAAPG